MSIPEEKTRLPAPATTTARIESSFSSSGTRDIRSETMERRIVFRGGFSIQRTATRPPLSMRTRGVEGIGPQADVTEIIVAHEAPVHTLFLSRHRYCTDAGDGHVREAVVRSMARRRTPVPHLSGCSSAGPAPSDRGTVRRATRGHILWEDVDVSRPRCRGRPVRGRSPDNWRARRRPRVPPPPEHAALHGGVLRGPPSWRNRRPDESDPDPAGARGPLERRGRGDRRGPRPVLAQPLQGEGREPGPEGRRLRRRRVSQDAAATAISDQEEEGPPEGRPLAPHDSARAVDPSVRGPREDARRFDAGSGEPGRCGGPAGYPGGDRGSERGDAHPSESRPQSRPVRRPGRDGGAKP